MTEKEELALFLSQPPTVESSQRFLLSTAGPGCVSQSSLGTIYIGKDNSRYGVIVDGWVNKDHIRAILTLIEAEERADAQNAQDQSPLFPAPG